MDPLDIKKRIFAAHNLLSEKTTTKQKFEQTKTLLKGINPNIDRLLEKSVGALSELEKFHKGEIIELTVEHLPDDTEERKKRKKALVFFMQNWKNLHAEVHRIRKEFEKNNQSTEQKIQRAGRIVTLAKGPLGIVTVVAVIAVVGFSLLNESKSPSGLADPDKQTEAKKKIQVIVVDGKQIPLAELITGQGPECRDETGEEAHYHAKDHVMAKALDGSLISDPGGCGFGKVKETQIIEIE